MLYWENSPIVFYGVFADRMEETNEQNPAGFCRFGWRKGIDSLYCGGRPRYSDNFGIDARHGCKRCGYLELGVPFSDPMADGPVIQRAAERALANGISLRDVLDVVRKFRETDTQTPVVLMGYLNPIHKMGYREFAQEAAKAGVDGVLTVDSPSKPSVLYIAS
ncbi:tryptophan synthase subunit alpha [Neisseria gonorrhoeae]|uniref:tryptophan synthase n=1 Tax=Neisseria gonorrhoeae TaxID=485 RepID=A0A378W1S0_NEIGO|nr:tryptophan synthase subunit alpha [Neisseria gonorrhoeae]